MLNISNLKAGRIYSFRHQGDVEIKKFELVEQPDGKKAREYAPEWLTMASITRLASFKGNLACPESYARAMVRENGEYTPTEREPWFTWQSRNGIVSHKTNGKQYLALVNPDVIKSTYFVNGVEATSEQVALIKRWKKGKGEFGNFAVFSLESVECTGEVPA